MDKMSYRTPAHHQSGRLVVEVAEPSVVFDIASLMLYGSQATPIRLKILLDRLFSVVQHAEIVRVLNSFGWSYEDYCRGYILQESSSGRVLDKWSIVSPEEELIILQQFLRFGETQTIARELIDRCGWEQVSHGETHHCLLGSGPSDSDIKNVGTQSLMKGYDAMHQILSRNLLYPHLASVGFARLLALHELQTQGMATSNLLRNKRGLLLSNFENQSAMLSSRSPLQNLQPFGYRKDSSSSVSSLKTASSQIAASMNGGLSRREGRTFSELAYSGQGSGIPPVKGQLPMNKAKTEIPEQNNITTRRITDETEKTTIDEGVINYSTRDRRMATVAATGLVRPNPSSIAASHATTVSGATGSSIFVHQKLKQLRKLSSNSMKQRPWQPTLGYGGTLISPSSGKKRVLCTACHKTFCDKGALKIHYSAVHLREMHRCTVDGCAMMFSSRRSRNRHSANPNPKLHLPQTGRRKLPLNFMASKQADEDDDDDEDEEEEEEEVGSESPFRSGSSTRSDSSGGQIEAEGFERRSNPDVIDVSLSASSDTLMVEQVAGYPLRVVPRFFPCTGFSAVSSSSSVQGQGTAADDRRLSHSGRSVVADHRSPEEEAAKEASDEGEGKDREEANQGRSGSKRKSAVPTKCSPQTNTADSDDDDDDESSGDSKRPRHTCDHFPVTSESFYSAKTTTEKRDTAMTERNYVTASKVDDSGSSSSSSSSSSNSSFSNEPMRSEVVYSERNKRFDNVGHQSKTQRNHDVRANRGPVTTNAASDVILVNTFSSHLNDTPSLSLTAQKNNCVSEIFCDENSAENDRIGSRKTRTVLETCDSMRDSSDVTPRGNGFFRENLDGPPPLLVEPESADLARPGHICVVVGCNATFHSKRSRDRHSANRNLHHRLLSTAPPSGHEESACKMPHDGSECSCAGLTGTTTTKTTAATTPTFEGHRDANEVDKGALCAVLNLSKNVQTTDGPQSGASGDPNDGGRGLKEVLTGHPDHSTINGSPVPPSISPPARIPVERRQTASLLETDDSDDYPAAESFDAGGCVVCHLCQHPFKDNLALKEHREDVHPMEFYRCTIIGCDKIFSTRKSRNRHSQNDNLHKHLPIAS